MWSVAGKLQFHVVNSQESCIHQILIIVETLTWTIRCQETSPGSYFNSFLSFCCFAFCVIVYSCCYFFVSAVCFAWLSASSDPSASYPGLWQGLARHLSTENVLWSSDCFEMLLNRGFRQCELRSNRSRDLCLLASARPLTEVRFRKS